MDRFGIQLYSVREEIKTLGFDAVLGMIKRAGYDCVEFAGFYDYTPDEVVALLEKHGLEGYSAHMAPDVIAKSLEYIDKIGIKTVYIPWVDQSVPYNERVEAFKAVKPLLDGRGITYGYHNHSMEYKDGGDVVADYLRDIDGFYSQLDVFWAKVGGHEPTELMRKYGDRLVCLHIKDLDTRWTPDKPVHDYPCAIIGEGQADCEGAIRLGKEMGINTFILEVEGFPCDPEEYLTKSCNNMKKFAKESKRMSNIVKIGVIGCGGIANGKHMPAYKANKSAEMVAFCDIIPERAEKACREYGAEGAKIYVDYKELLKDESIDAVLVLTHNSEHCRITVDALNAGKHVLCEKPMAMSYEETQKMINARNKSGKLLTIGYQGRFRPDSLYLKKLADANEFGEVYYAEAIAIRRRAVPTWGVFIDEEKQGGGPLIDIGTHALDLTLFTMNNYEPAYCVGKTFHKLNKQTETGNVWGDWDTERFTAEDAAFGFVVMKNGAVINLRSSWALNYAEPKEAITVLCGTKAGADMLAGPGNLRLNGIKAGKQYVAIPDLTVGKVDFFEGEGTEPADLEAATFVNAILGKGELYVTAEQAAVVTRILEGIYVSDKTGAPYYFN